MTSRLGIFSFIFKWVVVGLAIAFLVVLVRPDLLRPGHPVVEFRETSSPNGNGTTHGEAREPAQDLRVSGPVSYSQAVEAAAPAVVNIYTATLVTERVTPLIRDPLFRYFFGESLAPRTRKKLLPSLGSGVIVSAQGYVLTNNHVVEGADEIRILIHDGRTATARVVGSDPDTDLALLKIDLENIPVITMANSTSLRVGDVVLAIGNPFGVGQTVTLGIVSATGRNQLGISIFEDFIQTDAAINPGNSGGALINARGELVGINSAIASKSGGSQGIGFAIPVNLAKGVMQQLIEHGHAVRGWLGVQVQNLTPKLADAFGINSTDGVLVSGILRDEPAHTAGVRPGDILTHINGMAVGGDHESLNIIARLPPESTVTIKVIRDGKPVEILAKVGERPTGAGR